MDYKTLRNCFRNCFVINFFNAKKYLMWKYLSEQSLINLNLI